MFSQDRSTSCICLASKEMIPNLVAIVIGASGKRFSRRATGLDVLGPDPWR